MKPTLFALLAFGLLLSGCALSPNSAPIEDRDNGATGSAREPASSSEGVEVFAMPAPAPATSAPLEQRTEPLEEGTPSAAPPASQSPAVIALLDNAERQSGAGNLDSAAAALERALRIEPGNAVLWQRLADVRLRQKQPEQAESLALKSNSLAAGDPAIQAANWRIIAKARRLRGDTAGAREAEERAGRM